MGLFSSKTKLKPLILPEQRDFLKTGLSEATPGAVERLRRAGEEYPGELTAPLSKYEESGLDTLEGWLGTEMPQESKLYGLGREEYEKTLGGEFYDPSEGQYYQAYKAALDRELQEAKDRLAAKTSARDQFYSGGRVAGEAELEEESMLQRALILADLAEKERERRLGTVPAALDLLTTGEAYPLARVAATQEYGALPRTIEQQGLDREYNEYIRQLQDLGVPLETAVALATKQYDWYAKQSGGEFWDIASALGSVAGIAGGLGGLSGASGMYGGGVLSGGGGGSSIAGLLALLSDIRFKENLTSIDNALEKTKTLDGKTYNYIENKNLRCGGIIAQDLEKVLPEAVHEIQGIKYVRYDAVMALLINAIKELDGKIERIGA